MEAPSPRYILTRAAFFIAVLVAGLYGMSFIKKKQRQSAIISELKSISGDSTFYQSFYPEDAKKTLIRAIGLIAEAKQLGIPPDTAIKRAVGIESKFFASDGDASLPPVKTQIVISCLSGNYENFVKLGYKGDFHTLSSMKEGTLPAIPGGPDNGKKPIIITLIDPSISPGIDKVIANLQIRPPQAEDRAPSDIEISAAKQLARDLADAGVIEESVRERILAHLTPPKTPPKQ